MFLASWVAGIQQQVDEAEKDPYFYAKADVNNDGSVNGADVVYMASAIAGLPGFIVEDKDVYNEPGIDMEPGLV